LLTTERDNIRSLIHQTKSDIEAAEKTARSAKDTFVTSMGSFSAQIKESFGAPGAEQLASILLNLSFMPEKGPASGAMVASQAIAGASEALRAGKSVTLDDGTQVDRSLVINRLDAVGADVADFGAGYRVLSEKFIQKDSGIYRLVQKAPDFEALCVKFYEKAPGARAAKTQMDAFLRAAIYKNAKIDEYNALWAKLGDIEGQLARATADSSNTALDLARSEDPGLPHRVAAFDNLYNRMRDIGLKYAYFMSRAYALWALKPYDQLASVCKLADPDGIDAATLEPLRRESRRHTLRNRRYYEPPPERRHSG
jgi:hypothetical protein